MSEIDAPQTFLPLIGTEEASIDEKWRVVFSQKKRERLGEPFAIVLGAAGRLEAMPTSVLLQRTSEVLRYSPLNDGRQRYSREAFSEGEDGLEWDKQGRVLIPPRLRQLGRLKERGKVMLVGAVDRVEIWDKDEYDAQFLDPRSEQRREAIKSAYREMTEGEAR
jgi:MraZ protein